jgi:hypothetical protein
MQYWAIFMQKSSIRTILMVVLTFGAMPMFAQPGEPKIELGPDEVGLNQAWTITVTVETDRLQHSTFPDINGFRKVAAHSQSMKSIINGKVTATHSVIQNYIPERQGTITIPPFSMTVNGKSVRVAGKKVKVGAASQQQTADPFRDPMDDFFGRRETEFVDVKEEAFLALTTNKDEVYTGEGINTTLAFYVADNNRAAMQFHDLGKQLADILKKLRPANCWEENFNIENIEGESVDINGRGYTQYKIYQGTFFPLNTAPVKFPSIGLEMIKYKMAKNPTFFGQNRQESFKTFYSKEKVVKVKELPPHPLRDAVAVGEYRVEERLNAVHLKTGQSVSYDFNIYGEGNISAIEKPAIKRDDNFEFYEPNVQQAINRESGRITGAKSFSYFMIPKEPGDYKMKDYFKWVYFSPAKNRYDTLMSKERITVTGESQKNQSIESSDLGSFYTQIDSADNSFRNASPSNILKWCVNILAVVLLGVSVYLIQRKWA